MSARQNRADYRLALEGKSLGPGGEPPLPEFARALMERFGPRLVSLTLTEKRDGEADRLDLVLDDSDGRLEIPQPGQVLSLKLGWAAGADVAVGLVDKGRFKVDEAEWSGPPDQITVRARSANFAASFDRRRERAQVGRTLGAIIDEIAKLQGLVARVDPELAKILLPVLDQDELSDAGLLLQLGRRFDAAATVKNGALLFLPIGKGRTATGIAIPAAAITRASGDGFAYKRAERGQYGGVEARWHDRKGGKRSTVMVGGAEKDHGGKPPKRLKRTYGSEDTARRAAESSARKMDRARAEFSLTLALGRPELHPEQPLSVTGFKPEIDAQRWLISECQHTLTGQAGLTTKLTLEAAG